MSSPAAPAANSPAANTPAAAAPTPAAPGNGGGAGGNVPSPVPAEPSPSPAPNNSPPAVVNPPPATGSPRPNDPTTPPPSPPPVVTGTTRPIDSPTPPPSPPPVVTSTPRPIDSPTPPPTAPPVVTSPTSPTPPPTTAPPAITSPTSPTPPPNADQPPLTTSPTPPSPPPQEPATSRPGTIKTPGSSNPPNTLSADSSPTTNFDNSPTSSPQPSPTRTKQTPESVTTTFWTTEASASIVETTSTYSSDGKFYTTTYAVGTTTVAAAHQITSVVPASPTSTGSGGSNAKPIVGGIVGSLAGLAIIGGLLWLCIRRQRKTDRIRPYSHTSDGMRSLNSTDPRNVISPFQDIPGGAPAGSTYYPSDSASLGNYYTPMNAEFGQRPGSGHQQQLYRQPGSEGVSGVNGNVYNNVNVGRPNTGGSMSTSDRGSSSGRNYRYTNVPFVDPFSDPNNFEFVQQQDIPVYSQPATHRQTPPISPLSNGKRQLQLQQQQQEITQQLHEAAVSNTNSSEWHPPLYDPYYHQQKQQIQSSMIGGQQSLQRSRGASLPVEYPDAYILSDSDVERQRAQAGGNFSSGGVEKNRTDRIAKGAYDPEYDPYYSNNGTGQPPVLHDVGKLPVRPMPEQPSRQRLKIVNGE